ncbi:glycerophosphodiester phosphodiesterase [Pedococcus soli]
MRSLRLVVSAGAATLVAAAALTAGAGTAGAATATAAGAVPASAARPLTVGHRGSSAVAPENTLASFALAVRQGADLVESDVQRSKDGGLVLMHDTTLARTTNVEQRYPTRSPWRVADFTLAEIRTLDAGSWKSSRYAGQRVPTLAELVKLVRYSRSGILIELKSPSLYPGIEAQVTRTWKQFPGYLTTALRTRRLVVQSFDATSLRRYHVLQPEVPVGLLGTPAVADLPALSRWVDQVNPAYATFDAAYVAQAHRWGLQVLAWTVDGTAAMDAALDRGVDGVITNRPDLLEAVLTQRAAGVTSAVRHAA